MSEENVDLVRQLYRHWENGDLTAGEFFDPEVEYVRIGAEGVGASGVWRGLDEMLHSFVDWLQQWEDVRMTASRLIDVDDQRVLGLVTMTARGKHSGLTVDYDVGHVFTICDGKVARWEDYRDPNAALKAVATTT